jgi:hypothetical protein
MQQLSAELMRSQGVLIDDHATSRRENREMYKARVQWGTEVATLRAFHMWLSRDELK